MLTNGSTLFLAAVCLGGLLTLSPTPAVAQSTGLPAPSVTPQQFESWFGWIETPKQQLRTILRVERDWEGKATAGFIISPDQNSVEIRLTKFQIGSNGEWQFTVENPVNANRTGNYTGKQSSPNQVDGYFEQGGEKLSLKMRKVDSMPMESTSNLGADSVWLGTLDMKFRKDDYRMRVYSNPPFATAEAPRLLFDWLTQNLVGIPAEVSLENGNTTFDMKSIGAKFVATLNENGNELDGRFFKGSVPLPLLMKLRTDEAPSAVAVKEEKLAPPSSKTSTQDTTKVLENGSPLLLESEKLAPTKRTDLASSSFFEETPFEVTFGGTKSKKGKEPAVVENAIKLAGTLTIPKLKSGSQSRRFPTVIMVSGSGPQDRNETIGRHKPFQTIAHYLAENGIASLRYDDRGVGESTGDYLNATSEAFANDALVVWTHATTIPELDASKIGILGHSEGGLIGPMAAVWEPKIAFLILIAPPGITGSEILKTQIDHFSELQGMNETDRKATMTLQGKLQDIASGYFTDEITMRRDIQNAIRQNWDSLKSIAKSQDPNANLDQMRKNLTSQVEGQFQQLRMPWYRFFLSYDPTPNWMMVRCPTLAIWGSNDVQVLPEINRSKIAKAIERNQKLEADLEILPGLNHWLQTSKTGIPEEYDEIEETISPKALSTIRIWAEEQGLIER